MEASVFVECRSMYRAQGPDAMRPVGEMEFIRGIGAMSDAGAFSGEGVCRAAVGQANLQLGDAVAPVLEALDTASGERMRGVRASVCWDASDSLHRAVPGDGYLADPAVRKGIGVLDRLGLSLDCWLYHPQIPQLTAVADAFPNLTIVLNHAGTPILGGPYKDRQDVVRNTWLESMAELARRERVFVKLGALPARFERDDVSLPADSHAVARAWQPWIQPCIELFGAARCMFESNFPVHKNWLSYAVLWNAFKRIAGGASGDEKDELFAGTAQRAYRMQA
jgi:predicted TIM-barrel fold metal-dependent hydrolase